MCSWSRAWLGILLVVFGMTMTSACGNNTSWMTSARERCETERENAAGICLNAITPIVLGSTLIVTDYAIIACVMYELKRQECK